MPASWWCWEWQHIQHDCGMGFHRLYTSSYLLMEAFHWVSNGSQSNLHHNRKHRDSAVYLVPVQKKNASYMMLNLWLIKKIIRDHVKKEKLVTLKRNVTKSEWICHKHSKFPMLVIKTTCNLSKKAENQYNKSVLTVPKAVCKDAISLQGPILSCSPMETSSSG